MEKKITSKLNSAFGTTGKATGVKKTAEAVGKNSSSRFSMKNFNFAHVVMQWNMSAKFGIFFCFWLGFFTLAWMKNYCYWPSLRISFIWSPVFGNFRFFKWTVPSTLNFCIFNLRRPSGGSFIFFIRFIQIFIGVLFSYYKTNEKRNKWALITQLKYDWSLNKFDLPPFISLQP